MHYGTRRWITATAGTVYEPKTATEAEVASYQDGQRRAIVVSLESGPTRYVVYRNYQTGQVLFGREGCLTPEQENQWRKVGAGSYSFCLDKVRCIRHRQKARA